MAAIIRYDRVPYPNPVSIKNTGTTALEAGQILGLKGLVAGERELYTVGAHADGDTAVIIAPSILFYDEAKTEDEWTLPQNGVCRGYILQRGEMYTVAKKFEATVSKFAVVRETVDYEGQESIVIEVK
ncbi:MAG: hypothetical protein ACRC18_07175 [Cetobacterium sp.]